MGKKKKFSVYISKEYCVVAEDGDQANLKVQQHINTPMEIFKEFKIETAELDMEYERLCGRNLYDGIDIK